MTRNSELLSTLFYLLYVAFGSMFMLELLNWILFENVELQINEMDFFHKQIHIIHIVFSFPKDPNASVIQGEHSLLCKCLCMYIDLMCCKNNICS